MHALDKSDNRTWWPMTSFIIAATLAAILDHAPIFSEEAFMSLIRHWNVSPAWSNWYVSFLTGLQQQETHFFKSRLHITRDLEHESRLFCTIRTIRSYKDDTLSISVKWIRIHFSFDSSSENPRRNTTQEILFSNYDKDVRPNQGGSYIRFVHQDHRRLNVLLKLFYMPFSAT